MFTQGEQMETRPLLLSVLPLSSGARLQSPEALLPQENSQLTRAHEQNTHHKFMAINTGG